GGDNERDASGTPLAGGGRTSAPHAGRPVLAGRGLRSGRRTGRPRRGRAVRRLRAVRPGTPGSEPAWLLRGRSLTPHVGRDPQPAFDDLQRSDPARPRDRSQSDGGQPLPDQALSPRRPADAHRPGDRPPRALLGTASTLTPVRLSGRAPLAKPRRV